MRHREILASRIAFRRLGLIDVRSDLLHFALITYALPAERLRPYIPSDFDIPTFLINGQQMALMSAVPFLDADFRFPCIAPFIGWSFGQTNYRVYIVDKATGEHCVWFFGTSLGSWVVHIAKTLWGIPWHHAQYSVKCNYNSERLRYDHFQYSIKSEWATAEIDLIDTGNPMQLNGAFRSLDEQILILTHPIAGYFKHQDGNTATYSVWHDEIPFTIGMSKNLYFSLYEKLGLLTRAEMQSPHLVLICPKVTFDVHLPPQKT